VLAYVGLQVICDTGSGDTLTNTITYLPRSGKPWLAMNNFCCRPLSTTTHTLMSVTDCQCVVMTDIQLTL